MIKVLVHIKLRFEAFSVHTTRVNPMKGKYVHILGFLMREKEIKWLIEFFGGNNKSDINYLYYYICIYVLKHVWRDPLHLSQNNSY